MDGLTHLAIATAAFLATHCVSSTPLRGMLVNALGERPYFGLYSLVAALALGWMIVAYGRAPQVPLWPSAPAFKAMAVLLMPFAMILLVSGVTTKNPTAAGMVGALAHLAEAKGILRITRHPVQWGIALWALLHLLARGSAAGFIFFGGLFLLSASGTLLIDARKKAAQPETWSRFAAVTSNLPCAAILQGRNRLRLGEIGWGRIAGGVALYAVVLLAHPYLFGVRPW